MTIISLDIDALQISAGVEFDSNDVNEFVHLLSIYQKRFTKPEQPIPDFMLVDAIESLSNPRNSEMHARRAFVEAVEGVWREAGGRGNGTYYDPDLEVHTGPLLLLLQKLLQAIGDNVSAATLHHDVQALRLGRERDRGRDT